MISGDSIQETTTDMFAHISEDERFLLFALAAAFLFGLFWWWNRSAKKWLEKNGREEVWPSALAWLLHRLAYGDGKEKDGSARRASSIRNLLGLTGRRDSRPRVVPGIALRFE
jgi:hypothetical protein